MIIVITVINILLIIFVYLPTFLASIAGQIANIALEFQNYSSIPWLIL